MSPKSEVGPKRASLFPGGVQSFVQPRFDKRLAVDAAQFCFAVQHCKHMLGKINVHPFESWLFYLRVFQIKSSDSRSSPASNRSASSSLF
jgi:hypothetical protein